MRSVVRVALVLAGLACALVAVAAFRAAFAPCTANCSVFAENAKLYKGYGAAATTLALVAWAFAAVLSLDARRTRPPYRIEERP